jgi:hypothetical protein
MGERSVDINSLMKGVLGVGGQATRSRRYFWFWLMSQPQNRFEKFEDGVLRDKITKRFE